MAFSGFKKMFEQDDEPEVTFQPESTSDDSYKEEDQGNLEIRVVRPKKFEEATEIAASLLNGCLVFLNLESTDKVTSRRILDYLLGTTYVIKGDLQPVSSSAFIISPDGVDITGATAAETAAKLKEEAAKGADGEGFGSL